MPITRRRTGSREPPYRPCQRLTFESDARGRMGISMTVTSLSASASTDTGVHLPPPISMQASSDNGGPKRASNPRGSGAASAKPSKGTAPPVRQIRRTSKDAARPWCCRRVPTLKSVGALLGWPKETQLHLRGCGIGHWARALRMSRLRAATDPGSTCISRMTCKGWSGALYGSV